MIALVLAVVLIVLGSAIVVRTFAEGVGGGLGILIGTVFIVAGAGRLLLTRKG